MAKVCYEEMLPHEIVARRATCPAAFIALGGLEWHGEHLAVGNDALKGRRLCELAAERSGGFAMPPVWFGEPRILALMEADHDPGGAIAQKMGFRTERQQPDYWQDTPEQQEDRYRALLRHVLIQMTTLEMRAVCFLCGHYPTAKWAGEAAAQFNARHADARAFAAAEMGYAPDAAEVGGDHAAKWETSYLWHLRPDCVDMSVYLGRDDEELVGIMGTDPRGTATKETGRLGVERIVEGMSAKAGELLAAAGWREGE